MARRRFLFAVLLAVIVALVAPAVASASIGPVAGFLGLPAVGDILESIFKKLVDLVVPKDVAKAWSKVVAWLVAVPDPTSRAFSNLNHVRAELSAAAVGLLSLNFILAAFRYWAAGFGGDTGVATALRRCVLAVVALIAYPEAVSKAIAGVNTLTGALVLNPTVVNGLDKVLGVAFLLAAATSGLSLGLAVAAVLAALAFFAGLLVLKILLTTLLCVLILAGPLVISFYPLPATEWTFRAWAAGLMAAIVIPVAWAVIFATGALVGADALVFTHSKFIVTVAKPFVAVACLYAAWKAPAFIVSRAQMAGLAPGLPIPGMRGPAAQSNNARTRDTSRLATRNADRFRALRQIGAQQATGGLRSLATKASSTASTAASRATQAAAAGVRLGTGRAGKAAEKTAGAASSAGRSAAAVADAARRGHAWWAKDLPTRGAAQRAPNTSPNTTPNTTPTATPAAAGLPAGRPAAPSTRTPNTSSANATAPPPPPTRPPQPPAGAGQNQGSAPKPPAPVPRAKQPGRPPDAPKPRSKSTSRRPPPPRQGGQ